MDVRMVNRKSLSTDSQTKSKPLAVELIHYHLGDSFKCCFQKCLGQCTASQRVLYIIEISVARRYIAFLLQGCQIKQLHRLEVWKVNGAWYHTELSFLYSVIESVERIHHIIVTSNQAQRKLLLSWRRNQLLVTGVTKKYKHSVIKSREVEKAFGHDLACAVMSSLSRSFRCVMLTYCWCGWCSLYRNSHRVRFQNIIQKYLGMRPRP